MVTVKDIAKILVAKHKLSNAEAEIFIQMIVEVVHEGLLRDRQVKIKGFGTFKLQAMKERSSVNVNTGEKVLIGEHDKITFTPDNVMKDLINKPFAQFETVPINYGSPLLDNSSLSDTDTEEDAETVTEVKDITEENTINIPNESYIVKPQTEIFPTEEDIPTPNIEEKEEVPEVETSESQEIEKEEAPIETETVDYPQEEAKSVTESECEQQYPHCHNVFLYYAIIINIVVAISAFTLGYMASSQQWFVEEMAEANTQPKVDNRNVAQQKQPTSKQADTTKNTAKPATEKTLKDSTVSAKNTASTVKNKRNTDSLKEENIENQYNDDVRVRTGAYNIVGIDKEVVVRQGQTIQSISRTYLGEGMECYIEALNGKTTVKAGEKIKIPKLKLKKRKHS